MTEDELLKELIAEASLPPLLDGDITIKRLAQGSKLVENTWRDRMRKHVEAGEYKIVWKRNANGVQVSTYVKA